MPILKIIHAIKHDQILNDRTKHMSELKIREALEFAVFSSDIAIGELQTGKLRLLNKTPAAAAREDGLEFLVSMPGLMVCRQREKQRTRRCRRETSNLFCSKNLRREGEILRSNVYQLPSRR